MKFEVKIKNFQIRFSDQMKSAFEMNEVKSGNTLKYESMVLK